VGGRLVPAYRERKQEDTLQAIIVAAGRGTRLGKHSDREPKTLLPYGDGTILAQILANFAAIDVTQFVIVVGYRAEAIREYLAAHDHFGLTIRFVENPQWERGNGISVYSARQAVAGTDPVFLSMSDHLVDPRALSAIRDAGGSADLLLTDPDVEGVFDIEDATKVRLEGDRIREIGKGLTEYNAVDCGVFRLTQRFFDALERQITEGKESISDGAQLLIEKEEFRSVSIPEGSFWIDIDTPESYVHADSHRERFYRLHRAASLGGLTDPTP
jgi:choline kinase